MLDYVPNHTSDQHEWFIKSVNKTDKYTDYYIWSDGKVLENGTRVPPNNWVSLIHSYYFVCQLPSLECLSILLSLKIVPNCAVIPK